MKAIFKLIKLIIFSLATVAVVIALALLYWQFFAKPYLDFPRPSGGDLYNALTYASFFKQFLTWPPAGWMHWWHEGTAVIGGYAWLFFYLITPLYHFFDLVTTVQVASLFFLELFFVFSFILLLVISRNLIVATLFTIVLLFAKASFYPLFVGGFVAESSAQWLLPLSLTFLFLWQKSFQPRFLVLAILANSVALLLHSPTAALLIFLPSLMMIIAANLSFAKKITSLMTLGILTVMISSIGLFTLYNQVILGSGNDPCDNPYCWGVYPEHFFWFNILIAIYPLFLLLVTLGLKTFKRNLQLSKILPFIFTLAVPIIYLIACYYKLINSMAGAYFPRRVFWAVSLLLLVLAASCFRTIRDIMPKVAFFISLILIVIMAGVFYLQPKIITDRIYRLIDYPAVYPQDAQKFTLEKYKKEEFTDRIPKWLPYNESNYRFGEFNQEMNIWWNLVSAMPITLGYSNFPLGSHRDWLYFLQSSISRDQPAHIDLQALRNRAYFLFDAFGIGYYENSGTTALHPALISDSTLVTRTQEISGLYLEYSKDIVTPIVSPTNTPPVLFIGDNQGYTNFIRVAALANLNSRIIIPVKGPDNFDRLDNNDLKYFKTIVLYRFHGNNWSKLKQFVEQGGNLFIDISSISEIPQSQLPEIFPVSQITSEKNIEPNWQNSDQTPLLTDLGINQASFSSLTFNNGPWGLTAAPLNQLRSWAKPLLIQKGQVLMARGNFGQGIVVWSGWNLLYHIVNYNNLEEANLMAKILSDFTKPLIAKNAPIFQVQRLKPEKIEISASNITGVYFKENYHSGWQGKADNQKLKLYPAGLDFMYWPVADTPTNTSVELTFTGGLINWGLFIISLITTLACIIYLLLPSIFHKLADWGHQQVNNVSATTHQQVTNAWNRE